ncbi:MAG TPA: AAA family ATPase, partial [Longimicrobium sp.]|nr:AAA family ATPase [Longimicrobium sp.]
MSERTRQPTPFHLLGRATPLLGRERELAALEDTLDACLRGSARAVLLSAPAGVGKSRVRHELVHRATTAHPELEVWMGRGNPTRAGAPFSLLMPALRHALGLLDGEPAHVLRDSLRTRMGLYFPDEADQERVTLFIGHILGLPFDDPDNVLLRSARQDVHLMIHQLRQAFVDLLAVESALRPVLIVLEDMHWGDTPSLAFLDFALAELPDRPWMVLALGRPEARALHPELWTRTAALDLPLEGLPADLMRLRAREALRGDEGAVTRVVEGAHGNMRLLEERIRAAARGDGGEASVEALSRARLEALSPDLQRVLRAASTFGRSFRPGGVQALLGTTPTAEVRRMLGELAERELVARRDEGLPGEEEWGFRSDPLREAAYAATPDAEREAWHRLAGEWLLAQGEGCWLTLAIHFEKGKAVQHVQAALLNASRQALEAGDFAAAVARVERAMTWNPPEDMRGELRLTQARAHRCRGETDLAGKRATEALGLLPQGSTAWFQALEEAISAIGDLGGYQRVSAWTRQALTARPGKNAASAQVLCLCAGVRYLSQTGSRAFAEDVLHRIEPLLEDGDALDPLAVAQLRRVLAGRARHEGDLSGDLLGYQAAMHAFERAGDVRNAANARVSVGFAYIELGDYAKAEAELRSAMAMAERLRIAFVATRARQNLCLVLMHQGLLDEARALARQVIGEIQTLRMARFEGWTRIYLARIELARQDFHEAEAQSRRAADMLVAAPPARAGALAALARALVGLGRLEEAHEAISEAMRVFQTTRSVEEYEALIRLLHAEVFEA